MFFAIENARPLNYKRGRIDAIASHHHSFAKHKRHPRLYLQNTQPIEMEQ